MEEEKQILLRMAMKASADQTLTRGMQRKEKKNKTHTQESLLQELKTHLIKKKKRWNFNLFICTYIQIITVFNIRKEKSIPCIVEMICDMVHVYMLK